MRKSRQRREIYADDRQQLVKAIAKLLLIVVGIQGNKKLATYLLCVELCIRALRQVFPSLEKEAIPFVKEAP